MASTRAPKIPGRRAAASPEGCGAGENLIDWRVRVVLMCLEKQHSNLRLTIRALSEGLRLSEHYLGKLVKDSTGMTFRQHLRKVRMEHAQALLRDRSLPVKEIAALEGYREPGNFSKDFRRFSGMAPTEYREQIMDDASISAVCRTILRFLPSLSR